MTESITPCAICHAPMTFRHASADGTSELWTCQNDGKVQVYRGEFGKARQRRNGKQPAPELRKGVLFEAKYRAADRDRIRAAGYETDAQFLAWAILQLDKQDTV
jgi:hypothetical protein